VAEELRCTTLSKHPTPANKLNVELAQGLFDAWTRFLPMDDAAFHVVIIEEFERVVSQEVKGYLKTALDWSVDADAGLPPRCVVVATSNNVEKIESALLERFEVLQFSGGPSFAELAQERLAEIWLTEMPGEDMPHGWRPILPRRGPATARSSPASGRCQRVPGPPESSGRSSRPRDWTGSATSKSAALPSPGPASGLLKPRGRRTHHGRLEPLRCPATSRSD
jgi:hypothetical protein